LTTNIKYSYRSHDLYSQNCYPNLNVLAAEWVDNIMKEENFNQVIPLVQPASPLCSSPWFFQHPQLLIAEDSDRTLELKKLINKLNYINFTDLPVFFLLCHKQTNEQILIKAYPQPSVKNELISRLDSSDTLTDLTVYALNHLVIDEGLTTILAPVQVISIEGDIIKVNLPEISRIKTARKIKRFLCGDIACKIVQGDFNARGQLIDFSPCGLGISLSGTKIMKGFDESKSALINIDQNGNRLYSGLCRCIRNGINLPGDRIVFTPLPRQVSLFPKREIRNNRQHIAPSFSVRFKHPFFKGDTSIERDIFDISPAGFSIKDKTEEELLLPGMIIPNITIIYADIVKMTCSAQVVYRHEEPETKMVKCGLAIADMDLQSFTHLNHILGVSNDSNARVSSDIEMDSLWEFFFDTGFIYGEKYEEIQSYRETFKETYRKLYNDNTDIARHIVYKKNGKIYGHIAMVHAYEPSWLIHHFAARRMSHRLPGMTVLKHIVQYTGSYNRLSSSGMNHVMTYYQSKNNIIDRIFGNFTRHLNDLKKSSLDTFSYMLFNKKHPVRELPDGWVMKEITLRDLGKLKEFYESSSGGLLLNALGLDIPSEPIKKLFAEAGFKREYRAYCLCYEGRHMAFFVVNQSDIKLNLSDLINGIKVIVVEPTALSWAILAAAVNSLAVCFSEQGIPLLIFPSYFLSMQNIQIEKQYTLWILNAREASDDFLAYMNSLIKLKTAN
jgi:hypothetical protein